MTDEEELIAPSNGQTLRERAEEILRVTESNVSAMPAQDMELLIHELQVHQIELSLQNEELMNAQHDLVIARDKYIDLYDFSPISYVTLNRNGYIVEANVAAISLLGIERVKLLDMKLAQFITPEFQDSFYLYLRKVLRSGKKCLQDFEFCGVDNKVLTVYIESIAYESDSGLLIQTALVDITERKHAEEFKQTLMDELEHRISNMFAIIRSIARQMLEHSVSLDQFKESFFARLEALTRVFNLLSKNNWKEVSLLDIIEESTSIYVHSRGPGAKISGTRLMIREKSALAFYLILNELATNSAKYGSFSVSTGMVEISWTIEGTDLLLLWNESGGPSVSAPEEKGFGGRLIDRIMKHEFQGKAEHSYDTGQYRGIFRMSLLSDCGLVI